MQLAVGTPIDNRRESLYVEEGVEGVALSPLPSLGSIDLEDTGPAIGEEPVDPIHPERLAPRAEFVDAAAAGQPIRDIKWLHHGNSLDSSRRQSFSHLSVGRRVIPKYSLPS